ncbi:hypothetical protein PROFUN_07767 [Planoprotostelium fungivorum]|uniref:Uncharacterized protein n=1 Tax=Planoprotostelium fungivorum TaxID=1890364 RepID=A0A2P6MX14_9EUKA|nr:hypothetical protein PROFUN_07767 [Planoprotostelium fungivorum]
MNSWGLPGSNNLSGSLPEKKERLNSTQNRSHWDRFMHSPMSRTVLGYVQVAKFLMAFSSFSQMSAHGLSIQYSHDISSSVIFQCSSDDLTVLCMEVGDLA